LSRKKLNFFKKGVKNKGQRDKGTEGQRDRGTKGQRDKGTEAIKTRH